MNTESDIVEKWIGKVADADPRLSSALRAADPDPFRNPVAYAVRTSLAQLWEQMQGGMDAAAIDSAFDTVLRIRAVQDMSPSQAVGFVIQLRSILREAPAAFDLPLLESRIDQLSLAAFDKYMQCREQAFAARLHETERLSRTHRLTRTGVA